MTEQTGRENVVKLPASREVVDMPDRPTTLEEIYSAETLKKARALLDAGNVCRSTKDDTYYMCLGSGDSVYRQRVTPWEIGAEALTKIDIENLLPIEWVTCECANGSNLGGRVACYHSAAVLMAYAETPLGSLAERVRALQRYTLTTIKEWVEAHPALDQRKNTR